MSERTEKMFAERTERRRMESGLLEKGWRSTGDVPYSIQRRLQKVSSATIATNVNEFLKQVLTDESAEFAEANMTKVGYKTFVSPELEAKIEERVKKRFDLK